VASYGQVIFHHLALGAAMAAQTITGPGMPVPALGESSLPEIHASVRVSRSPFAWRRLLAFIGPGLHAFSVIMISNLAAVSA
jgi:hypothetical protein